MTPTRFPPKKMSLALISGLYVIGTSLWLWADRNVTHGAKTDQQGKTAVALNRDQMLLVVLSLAEGEALTPVKVQKALFLAEDKAADAFASHYDFQPYDYGPFDRSVYSDARKLAEQGLVEIGVAAGGWDTYTATAAGVQQGKALQQQLSGQQIGMLTKIVQLVRSLSFTELVSAIYRAYPRMRARSVFRD